MGGFSTEIKYAPSDVVKKFAPKKLNTLPELSIVGTHPDSSDAVMAAAFTGKAVKTVFWTPFFLFAGNKQSWVKVAEFDAKIRLKGVSFSNLQPGERPEATITITKTEEGKL